MGKQLQLQLQLQLQPPLQVQWQSDCNGKSHAYAVSQVRALARKRCCKTGWSSGTRW